MGQISSKMSLYDDVSAPIMRMVNATMDLTNKMEAVQATAERMNPASSFEAAVPKINEVAAAVEAMNQNIVNMGSQEPVKIPAVPEFNMDVDSISSDPIKVPVEPVWDSQKLLSVDNAMSRLADTQLLITRRANNATIFPPAMVSDINDLNARIEMLRRRIADMSNNPISDIGASRAGTEVEGLKQQLNQALSVQEQLNDAMANADISAANAAYNQLNNVISQTEKSVRDAATEQNNFNSNIDKGIGKSGNLLNQFRSIAGLVGGIFTIRSGFGFMQESLDLGNKQINAEQQLANVLKNQNASQKDFISLKQKAAAIQGKTMYGDESMIAGAGEISTYLKDVEAVKVAMGTLTNYAAGMSGGMAVSQEQMVNYATQLGKALDGTYDGLKKKGFELSDAQKEIIANGTDMQKALVIDEVINQSWAGLAEQMANLPAGKVAQLNNTLGDIKENVAFGLYPAVMDLLNTVQDNMPTIEQLMHGIGNVLEVIINIVTKLVDKASEVANMIIDNWPQIAPIITGIAVAIGVAAIAVGVYNVAQWLMNAAMWACPVTWIVIGLMLIVGAIYGAIAAMNHFAGTSVSATGIIAGLFVSLGAKIWNFIAFTWNGFATLVEFLVNVWTNFGYSLKKLIANLVTNVLNACISITSGFDRVATSLANAFVDGANIAIRAINLVINALNKIPGIEIGSLGELAHTTSITSGLQNVKSGINSWVGDAPEDYWETPRMEMKSIGDAFGKGYNLGAGLEDAINGLFDGKDGNNPYEPDIGDNYTDYSDVLDDIAGNTGGASDNTGAIKDAMGMLDEDLKYLRDIDERNAVNRYTTVNVSLGGVTNNVASELDLDGIVDYIVDNTSEAVAIAAGGVHK